jgi:hypothetical protein
MEKYVIFTTKGYFVGDLNCKAEFSRDIEKAQKFNDEFNVREKSGFLYRILGLDKYPDIEKVFE